MGAAPPHASAPIPARSTFYAWVEVAGHGRHRVTVQNVREAEGAVLRSGNSRRQVFDPAARAAGLEDLSPHDLRHTAASLLVASGANVKRSSG
jgi:integrase